VLRSLSPAGRVKRIGRAPDPWAWPDWLYAGPDGTFGNRWDDPDSNYRVLYAADDRLAAFLEVLARFRPDPYVLVGLDEIVGEDDDALRPGQLDASWLFQRRVGEATLNGRFADVGHSASLAVLRRDLSSRIVQYALLDLDAAAIRLRAPRAFTQQISRYVHAQSNVSGRAFDGISYLSRLGDEFRLWAIFEPATPREAKDLISEPEIARIASDDPDLLQALAMHGITLVS
jgi:hypothetical protein